MQLAGFFSLVLSIFFLLLSLYKLLGFGWAMAVIDLLTFQTTGNYSELQKNNPKSDTTNGRKLGFIFLLFAIVCFVFAVITL